MIEELFLPKDITLKSIEEFLYRLYNVNFITTTKVIINIRELANNNGRIEPIASLKLINGIKNFESTFKKINSKGDLEISAPRQITNTYAKTMRLYGALGINQGLKPNEDFKSNRNKKYLPLLELDLKEMKTKALYLNKEVDELSRHLAEILSNSDKKLEHYLDYSLNELIRNVLQHSGVNTLWCMAQVWPSERGGKCIELALMDCGKGIAQSLDENYKNMFSKPLRYAIIPGCSSKVTTFTYDGAENSGFGLFMTSEITRESGDFYIFSNNSSIKLSGDVITDGECQLQGTVIGMKLHIDMLSEYDIKISELIDKGNKEQREFKKHVERMRFAPGLHQTELYSDF